MKDEYTDAWEKAQSEKLGIHADDQEGNRRKLMSSSDEDFNVKALVSKAVLLLSLIHI